MLICCPLISPRGLHRPCRYPDEASADSSAYIYPPILQQLHQALTQTRTLEPNLALENYELSEEETWGGALSELCPGMRPSR